MNGSRKHRVNRILLPVIGASLVFSITLLWFQGKQHGAPEERRTDAKSSGHEVLFASPGRVEALNETIKIGAGVSGVLEDIPVQEGDHVKKGQVLARIHCRPTESELRLAIAQLDAAKFSHEQLLRGNRVEARREAAANSGAAEAAVSRAKLRFDRIEALFQAAVAPAA